MPQNRDVESGEKRSAAPKTYIPNANDNNTASSAATTKTKQRQKIGAKNTTNVYLGQPLQVTRVLHVLHITPEFLLISLLAHRPHLLPLRLSKAAREGEYVHLIFAICLRVCVCGGANILLPYIPCSTGIRFINTRDERQMKRDRAEGGSPKQQAH